MDTKKIILGIFSIFTVSFVSAQKLTMGYLFPAGGETGSTVEIEAGGLNLNKATKVVFNHQGIKGELVPFEEKKSETKKRKRLNDQSSPQLADRVRIRISIAPDVPCGLYDLRLQSPQGVSNMLPFEVASYPNFLESGKSTSDNPDVIDKLPVVLCGQATPGGIDYFRFTGHKGDVMVASVKGRSLVPYIADAVPGWFQPVIKIVDSKGREVAYSDDYLYNVDPLIITELQKDDEYTIMIHDAIYRGRQDFNYRIQLGVIPFVTGRYSAYGIAGKKMKQKIVGANLDALTETVTVKHEGYNKLTYTAKNGTSNAVSFYAVPKGLNFIQYPDKEVLLNMNSAVADSLTYKDKIKKYRIVARKKQPVIIELIGRRNGSRIDAVMRLVDETGKVFAKVDDTEDPIQGLMTFHADPVLNYVPKESGEMILEVEDLHRGYGMDYHYLLRRHKQMPSFNAFVSPANISVPSGGTSSFHIDISGKLKRPASLVVEGLPEGFTTSSMELQGGKGWDVSITSPHGADTGRFPIELKLKYPSKDGNNYSDVLPVDNMMQAFYYTHHIQAADLSVEVSEPSPYSMGFSMNDDEEVYISLTDTVIPVKISLHKDVNFKDTIGLELGKKSKIFTLDPVSVLPEETEKTVYIKLDRASLSKFAGKKFMPSWQMNIIGTVKGEIVKQGKRTFQNAKYREMTPFFLIKIKKEE